MNEEETLSILNIMATADYGCVNCVRDLFSRFIKKYPHYITKTMDYWNINFPDEEMDIEEWMEQLCYLDIIGE